MENEGAPIVFRAESDKSTFLDPRKNFSNHAEEFEVRYDPLTGRSTHYSHFGAIKPQKLPIHQYGEQPAKGFCPFCVDVRERVTPMFLERIIPEGRLSNGQAWLIPNLFPYDVYSGVVVMTNEHVIPLDGFTEDILGDAFSLGISFLKRIKDLDGRLPYHIMTWNYMPPSGGGLVHPHQQYFATNHPGNQFADELRASEAFRERYRRNFWDELVRTEIGVEERYIASTGSGHWMASFASMGVLGEVISVFPSVHALDDFRHDHIEELIYGIKRVFAYFQDAGIESFNASLFFGPEKNDYFSAHLRIIPRTFLNMRDFAPDFNFYQTLLAEPVCVVFPEELARAVKGFF